MRDPASSTKTRYLFISGHIPSKVQNEETREGRTTFLMVPTWKSPAKISPKNLVKLKLRCVRMEEEDGTSWGERRSLTPCLVGGVCGGKGEFGGV